MTAVQSRLEPGGAIRADLRVHVVAAANEYIVGCRSPSGGGHQRVAVRVTCQSNVVVTRPFALPSPGTAVPLATIADCMIHCKPVPLRFTDEVDRWWGVGEEEEVAEAKQPFVVELVAVADDVSYDDLERSGSNAGNPAPVIAVGEIVYIPQYITKRKIISKVVDLWVPAPDNSAQAAQPLQRVCTVGVSFTVSELDQAGFRERLTQFLQQFNPSGVKMVGAIMAKCTEVEVFTKVFAKYGITDYTQRASDITNVYHPERIRHLQGEMQKWARHEEQLMRKLVMDAMGPEPADIPFGARLTGFVKHHGIAASVDVRSVVASVRNAAPKTKQQVMSSLVAQHGAEPNPRTYLRTGVPGQAGVIPTPAPKAKSTVSDIAADLEKLNERYGRATKDAAGEKAGQLGSATAIASIPGDTSGAPSDSVAAVRSSGNELWARLVSSLTSCGIQEHSIFYVAPHEAEAVLHELQSFTFAEKCQLVAEWYKRSAAAVSITPLSASEAMLRDRLKQELAATCCVPQLALRVDNVECATNNIHQRAFELRVAGLMRSGAATKMSRRVLLLPYTAAAAKLQYGAAATLMNSSGTADPEKTSGVFIAGDVRFPTNPLAANGTLAAVCSNTYTALVCDVLEGNTVATNFDAPSSRATADPAADSVLAFANSEREALVLYDSLHVLPRYIATVSIDPSAVPCPFHPTNRVAFHCTDDDRQVCAVCCVFGEYRGKHLQTLEEAAAAARLKLSDALNAVEELSADLASQDYALQQQLERLRSTDTQRDAVLRAAEHLKQEAERKASALVTSMDSTLQNCVQDVTRNRRECVELAADVQQLQGQLRQAIHNGDGAVVLQTLEKLKASAALEAMQQRRREVTEHSSVLSEIPAEFAPEDFDVSPGAELSKIQRLALQGTRMSPASRIGPTGGHHATFSTTAVDDASRGWVTPSKSAPNSIEADDQIKQLYSKYVLVKEGGDIQQQFEGVGSKVGHEASTSSYVVQLSAQEKAAKELSSAAWKLFRSGNKGEAKALWSEAHRKYPSTSAGMRARAYISESVDKDYEAACKWYEAALVKDPQCTMTLFNYAVLLETSMHQKTRALALYQKAADMGDAVSGKRAAALRKTILDGASSAPA